MPKAGQSGAAFVTGTLILLGVVLGILSTPRAARAGDASIIIDADTGAVLEQHNADEENYPASLTKMMTLYLTFEALHNGKLTLGKVLPVSAHAAKQAPSKLGLQPGETITVHDAILALVTHSANDVASVLAEALGGGSEASFAERMTRKAKALGMKDTIYYNASGLPNRPENHTTARDLAILARALYRDFPDDYHYFATREFTWHGAVLMNHNHLMNSFQGMDGIKTGYIHASGFNLAASAVRGKRRLIGIVMGGQSARSRDKHMAALLNTAFAGTKSGNIQLANVEESDAADGEGDAAPAARLAEHAVAALSPVASAEAAPAAVPHHHVKHSASGWAIQIGAFSKHSAAERAAHATRKRLAAARSKRLEILAPERTDKERVWRVRFVDFTRKDADTACRALHRKHHTCAVLPPSAVHLARE